MKPFKFFVVLVVSCAAILCSSSVAFATTIIRVRVAPVREVVISDDGKITQVDSNTAQDVAPTIRRGSAGGPIVRITPRVQSEYQAIKGHIDFTRTGVVYRRPASRTSWLTRQLQLWRGLALSK